MLIIVQLFSKINLIHSKFQMYRVNHFVQMFYLQFVMINLHHEQSYRAQRRWLLNAGWIYAGRVSLIFSILILIASAVTWVLATQALKLFHR